MIKIGVLSKADSVKGQGVGSAYSEQIRLLKTYGKDEFDLSFNSRTGDRDVLHVHTVDPASFIKMRLSKKPSVVSIHMTPKMAENSMRLPRLIMKLFKWYLRLIYKSADRVHVVNPILKEEVSSYGYDEERIHYIPNFVAKSEFYPKGAEERKSLKEKYGYKKDDFIIFASGQTRKGKGVKDFADVAAALPDLRFIWAGGFPFGALADGYSEIKELIDSPPDNLRFTGIVSREEINDLLNISDLFFFPSYEELFPMSILEAASVNLPLLLRDLPEYRDILTDRYVKADSNEEFIEMIRKIQTDREIYDKMVSDSKKIADRYSEESIYRQWRDFYRLCAGCRE